MSGNPQITAEQREALGLDALARNPSPIGLLLGLMALEEAKERIRRAQADARRASEGRDKEEDRREEIRKDLCEVAFEISEQIRETEAYIQEVERDIARNEARMRDLDEDLIGLRGERDLLELQISQKNDDINRYAQISIEEGKNYADFKRVRYLDQKKASGSLTEAEAGELKKHNDAMDADFEAAMAAEDALNVKQEQEEQKEQKQAEIREATQEKRELKETNKGLETHRGELEESKKQLTAAAPQAAAAPPPVQQAPTAAPAPSP